MRAWVWLGLAACGGLGPGPKELRAVTPTCDAASLAQRVVALGTDHPDIAPQLPAPPVRIHDVRETLAEDSTVSGAPFFRRLCFGTVDYADGASGSVGIEMFATPTILGATWGLDACFEGHDRAKRDCSEYARGRMPGQIVPPG
ncbi:MAG: hypothetical protein H6733_16270 [Alphaproteobacteria bacterium]|nr:hypothetical protein [Alphaproteobacteria bacterium]